MSKGSAKVRPTPGPTLAPAWHTALLVALILAVALTGTLLARASPATPQAAESSSGAVVAFASIVLVQTLLVVYVARIGRGRWRLGELAFPRPLGGRRVVVDLGFAAAAVAVILGTESFWQSFVARPNAAARAFLPHTSAELGAWLFVAAVVGVSEEIVYRGYLQGQLAAFTRSAAVGGILSAVLFGIAHLEQGAAVAARAVVYGLVLGAVAHRRRSLVPGMIAHVVIDVTAGLLAAR